MKGGDDDKFLKAVYRAIGQRVPRRRAERIKGDDDDKQTEALSAIPIFVEYGRTALHQAARAGLEEVAVQLLAACPSLIDEVTADEKTALHCAAEMGHAGVVAQLLAVKPALIDETTNTNWTALHCAAANNHAAVVAQLLAVNSSPAFIDAGTIIEDKTALHFAAELGNNAIVASLLVAHPASVNAVMEGGSTVLHCAARRGHNGVVAQLLAANPALADVVANDGRTPLHTAAIGGNEGVVMQLLALRPALIYAIDRCGWTALHCAAYYSHGCSLCFEPTTLNACCSNESTEFDPYFTVNKGATVLHMAAQEGHENAVAQLLAACPTLIDVVDNENQTCLHCAAWQSQEFTMKLLLDAKPALVHAVDAKGNTILHSMMRQGPSNTSFPRQNKELIERVWEMNPAALHAINREGETPFHLAVGTDNDFATDLLQWHMTLDEAQTGRNWKKLASFLEMQCEELTVVLIPDLVSEVFEYLGCRKRK